MRRFAAVALLPALVLASTLTTSCDDEAPPARVITAPPPCDCAANEWCNDEGICMSKGCQGDRDCLAQASYLYCDTAAWYCLPRPCTGEADPVCGADGLCDATQGLCRPRCTAAAGSCPAGQICDLQSGRCQSRCRPDSCPAGRYCDDGSGTCLEGCSSDDGCSEGYCDVVRHRCAECVIDAHCGPGLSCDDRTCVCIISCSSRERCDREVGGCVRLTCPDEEQCREGEVCDPETHLCVTWECVEDSAECEKLDYCRGGWCLCDEEHVCQRHVCLQDVDCPEQHFCDPSSRRHLCQPGCRTAEPESCPEGQVCAAADHRCIVPPCADHGDCPPRRELTFWCDAASGTCQPGCAGDEDCPGFEETCNELHRCQGPSCASDEECGERQPWPSSRFCNFGLDPPRCMQGCRDGQDCPRGWPCRERDRICGCRADEDCPAEQLCRQLACVEVCVDDAGCPPGFFCDAEGRCLAGCLADELEPNDSFPVCREAPLVDEVAELQLSLCGSRADEDWLCFAAQAGTRVYALAAYDFAQIPLRLELYDANRRRLAVALPAAEGRTLLQHEVRQEGRLHLRVASDSFEDGRYSLQLEVAAPLICDADELEPNDDRSRPRQIVAGAWAELTLCPGNEDWYAVPLRPEEGLQLLLDHDPADGWLVAQAWHFDPSFAAPLAESLNGPEAAQVQLTLPPDAVRQHGSYLLRLYSLDQRPRPIPYTMELTLLGEAPCLPDAREGARGNDSLEQAVLLPPGEYHDLSLCVRDQDYFRIELEEGDRLAVATRRSEQSAAVDMVLELLDGGGNRLELSAAAGPDNRVSLLDAAAGSYYLRIAHPRGHELEDLVYSLTVWVEHAQPACLADDRFEQNDRLDQAADLGPLAVLPEVNRFAGLRTCASDEDYYLLDLTGIDVHRMEARALFRHAAGDLDMELLDDQGRLACPAAQCLADSEDDDEVIRTGRLPRGRYVLHVWGFTRQTSNSYDLELQITPFVCNEDGLEENDTGPTASPMGDVPFFREQLQICPEDQDWFQLTLPRGGDLRIFIHFFHLTGDLNLFLFDSEMIMLNDILAESPLEVEGMSVNNDECVIERGAAAGTYHVQVAGADRSVMSWYHLDAALIGQGEGCPEFWPH